MPRNINVVPIAPEKNKNKTKTKKDVFQQYYKPISGSRFEVLAELYTTD
jgi:hypothetical protein